ERQRELTALNKAIEDKQALQEHIAAAKRQLNDIHLREQALRQQTQALDTQGGAEQAQAAALDAALDAARKDLDTLIADQGALANDTQAALSPTDKEIATALAT